jgi:hypothetical protein
MRRLATVTVWAVLALGCEEPGSMTPPGNFPASVEFDTAQQPVVALGEAATFEARVLEADGSPTTRTDLRVTWLTNREPQEASSPAPGVYRVRVSPASAGFKFTSFRVEYWNRSDVREWGLDSKVVTWQAWGGPAVRFVKPVPGPVALVVGERRPLLAFAVAAQGLSSEARQWSSSAPAVATVSAAGEVTALSEGTATVTVRAGAASASFEVTVGAGALGPPGDGLWKLPIDSTAVAFFGVKEELPLRAAVDARGWPALVMIANGGTWQAPVLVRWSGSGWGLEAVTPGWTNVGPPTLLVDDRDRLVLVMTPRSERKTLVVARRPVTGPAGEWSFEEHPLEFALLRRLGVSPVDYGQAPGFLSARAVADGGLLVAHRVVGDFPGEVLAPNFGTGLLEGECTDGLRVVRVDDRGARLLEERHAFFPRGLRSLHDCDLPSTSPTFLAPRVQVDGGAGLDLLRMEYGPSARLLAQRLPDGGALPGVDGGWPLARWTFEMADRLLFLGDGGAVGSAWTPPGAHVADDSLAAWLPPSLGGLPEETWGFAAGERTVLSAFRHVEGGQLFLGLGVSRLPALPDFAGDETTGARLFPLEPSPPLPLTRPLILASGTRLLVSEPRPALGDPGGIERSTARGPFVRVKGFDLDFSAQWPLASDGAAIYAVGPRSVGFAVSRSTDEGATWQALVAFPRAVRRGQLEPFSTTAALATAEGSLYFSPGLATRQGFVEVTATPAGRFVDHQYEMELHRLAGDRLGVVARLGGDQPAVWWRVFRADGTVESEWDVPCELAQPVTPSAVLPDGSLLLVTPYSTDPLRVMHAAPGQSSLTRVFVPERAWAWLVPVSLGDRVVFGGEYRDGFRSVAAAFSTADAGAFSPVVPLRPDGGNFQTVLSAVADGPEVGFVVVDTGGLAGGVRTTQTWDSLRQVPGVPLYLRRPAP